MNNKIKVGIIIGSTRQGRFSEHSAKWVENILKTKEEIEVEVLDLKKYNLPFFDGPSPASLKGVYPNKSVQEWANKIKEQDAFVIIAPEYNYGYTGVLKNSFDSIYQEWNNKAIAFVGHGGVGGSRAIEQLKEIAICLQMAPIRNAVNIMSPWLLVDGDGKLKEGAFDSYKQSAENTITQLLWWAKALKKARENN